MTFMQHILGISTGFKAIFTPTFALLLLVVDALSLALGLPATFIADKQTLILVLCLQCVSVLMGALHDSHGPLRGLSVLHKRARQCHLYGPL